MVFLVDFISEYPSLPLVFSQLINFETVFIIHFTF